MRTFSLCGSRAWVRKGLPGRVPGAREGLVLTWCSQRSPQGSPGVFLLFEEGIPVVSKSRWDF